MAVTVEWRVPQTNRTVYSGLSSDSKPSTAAGSEFYETDTGAKFVYDGSAWTQDGTNGAAHTEPTQLAGERNVGTSNQYFVAVPETTYTTWATADNDTVVHTSGVLLFGVYVTVAVTGGNVEFRDGTDATGDVVATLVNGSAPAGTYLEFPGIMLNGGLFIDDASTAGEFIVYWRAQSS